MNTEETVRVIARVVMILAAEKRRELSRIRNWAKTERERDDANAQIEELVETVNEMIGSLCEKDEADTKSEETATI